MIESENTRWRVGSPDTLRRLMVFIARLLLAGCGLVGCSVTLSFLKYRRERDDLHTMWTTMYAFFRDLFRISFVIWGRWKVTGRENIPAAGGCIVAANHVSHIDPPLVGGGIVRPAYFMAKAELFQKGFFGKAIPMVGAYPVKRGAPDRAAMKRTLDLLASGEVVVIFPEGTRRAPDQMGEAEHGFGWLVNKARVPVIPVGIENSDDLLPRGAKFLRRSRVRVNIGDPLQFDDLWKSSDSRAAITEIGVRTMAAIGRLRAQGE